MVELVGDVCMPSELIIPIKDNVVGGKSYATEPKMSGSMFMSGGKLYFMNYSGAAELITSTA